MIKNLLREAGRKNARVSRKAKYIKYLQIKEEIDYEAKHDGQAEGEHFKGV